MHQFAPHRARLLPLIVAACALAGAGCGADPARIARQNFSPTKTTSQQHTTRQDAHSARSDTGGEADALWKQGTPIGRDRARAALLSAARSSTASSRRFSLRLRATITRNGGTASATGRVRQAPAATSPWGSLLFADALSGGMRGVRAADGSSRASLDVRLGLLAVSMQVRIVGDRLYVQRDGRWFDLGPAAGITLDVGRELFAHSPLVQVRAGRVLPDGRVLVRGSVGSAAIARQAAGEPSGVVRTALRMTTGVQFTATIDDGDLVADEISTGLRMPATAARVSGIAALRIVFVETYAAARIAPVKAPRRATRPDSLADLVTGAAPLPPPR